MELAAASHWRCVDFISDLHLQPADTQTVEAWATYLRDTNADAVFILGDLFEVWIGDDALAAGDSFANQCVNVLRAAGQRLDLYLMAGNRDFLMGSALMSTCNAHHLEDPCTLSYANHRWLLTHGDAWCLDDTQYIQFRSLVRSPNWQTEFLQKTLAQRQLIARGMREQSEARKGTEMTFADVDTRAACRLLDEAQADHMIHGHTHRPARHALGQGRERLVLSDWDATAMPPRAEVLRVRHTPTPGAGAYSIERIPPTMAVGTERSRFQRRAAPR